MVESLLSKQRKLAKMGGRGEGWWGSQLILFRSFIRVAFNGDTEKLSSQVGQCGSPSGSAACSSPYK